MAAYSLDGRVDTSCNPLIVNIIMDKEDQDISLAEEIEEAIRLFEGQYSHSKIERAIDELNRMSQGYETTKGTPNFLLSILFKSKRQSKSSLPSKIDSKNLGKEPKDIYVEIPKLAKFLLNLVTSEDEDYIIGDLYEDFTDAITQYGYSKAKYRLYQQVIISFGFLGGKKFKDKVIVRLAGWVRGDGSK